jgi:hypothetical protein
LEGIVAAFAGCLLKFQEGEAQVLDGN